MLNIFGIPRQERENTDELIFGLGEQMGVRLNAQDVEISHRTSSKKTAPIIVKFNSRRKRNEFWEARRKLKNINTTHLGFEKSGSIYINESLTEHNGNIFKKVWGELKKPSIVNQAFTNNGFIYVRVKQDSEKLLIRTYSDIIKVKTSTSGKH